MYSGFHNIVFMWNHVSYFNPYICIQCSHLSLVLFALFLSKGSVDWLHMISTSRKLNCLSVFYSVHGIPCNVCNGFSNNLYMMLVINIGLQFVAPLCFHSYNSIGMMSALFCSFGTFTIFSEHFIIGWTTQLLPTFLQDVSLHYI